MVSADSLVSEESAVPEGVTDEALKLLADLEVQCANREASIDVTGRIVSLLRGRTLEWSLLSKRFCMAVQRAIEKLPQDLLEEELLHELHGSVIMLIESPWGNYVVQQILQVLAPERTGFVSREIYGSPEDADRVFQLAKHKYGCRAMQRILEKGVNCPEHQPLIRVLIDQTPELSRTLHGHHVANKVLELTDIPGEVKTNVITAMCNHFGAICHSRNARDVLIKAMQEGSPEDANLVADKVFEHLLKIERLQDGKKSVDLVQAALGVQPHKDTQMAMVPGLKMRLCARDAAKARTGR